MKKSLFCLILLDILFLILLIISGSVSGILSDVFYSLAFLVPIFVGLCLIRFSKNPKWRIGLIPDKKSLLLTLGMIAPTILLIFGISAFTSFIGTYFGASSEVDVSGNFLIVLFSRALLPAVSEEILFRFIPLNLIPPENRRIAVFFSAAMFAIVHSNPLQMPYAFAAGLLFAVMDIAAENIYPSLIIHFLNNLFSAIWIRLGAEYAPQMIIGLSAIAVVSVAFIYVYRRSYKGFFYGQR